VLADVLVAKPFLVVMVHLGSTVVGISLVNAMHMRAGGSVPYCLMLVDDSPIECCLHMILALSGPENQSISAALFSFLLKVFGMPVGP
jgi:hypothetical protein